MRLRPEEQELYGFTADGQWDCATQSRILQLASEHLQKLSAIDGGWTQLLRDPADGRYWELAYPHSQMHGGGPARLTAISGDRTRKVWSALNAGT